MRRRLATVGFAALALVLAPGEAAAQEPQDPIERHLFPPELVMRFQTKLEIRPEQKDRLRKEVAQAQARFSELQWDLEEASGLLAELLSQQHPDEKRVLEQLNRVLDAERQVKTTQIRLMVRIKNVLTPEQQVRLQRLRSSLERPPP